MALHWAGDGGRCGRWRMGRKPLFFIMQKHVEFWGHSNYHKPQHLMPHSLRSLSFYNIRCLSRKRKKSILLSYGCEILQITKLPFGRKLETNDLNIEVLNLYFESCLVTVIFKNIFFKKIIFQNCF